MRAVLPGKPRATPQAFHTVSWRGHRILAYVTRQSLVILNGGREIIQTIHHDGSDELDGVRIDGYSGKIAAAWGEHVSIFAPLDQDAFSPKWFLEYNFFVENSALKDDFLHFLSWGQENELLVGSCNLQFYDIAEHERRVWHVSLANPVQQALFSPSAELIASRSRYDCLVKIWRRRSFGSGLAQFDFGYLAHPEAVTAVQWRDDSTTGEDEHHQTLFTICQDGKLRIWSAIDPHHLQILQLWNTIDLAASIQPRRLSNTTSSTVRHCVFLTRHDFSTSVRNAKEKVQEPQRRPFIEHLHDLATQTPDVCLVVDDQGHMSAWGLFNVGSNNAGHSDVLNVAHLEQFSLLDSTSKCPQQSAPMLAGFCTSPDGQEISLVLHEMAGQIIWLSGDIDTLLAPSRVESRLRVDAKLTGHHQAITSIEKGQSDESVLAWSSQGEVLQWIQRSKTSGFLDTGKTLLKEATIRSLHILSEEQLLVVHEEELHVYLDFNGQLSDSHILKHDLQKEVLSALTTSKHDTSPTSLILVTANGIKQLEVPKSQTRSISLSESGTTMQAFEAIVQLAVISPHKGDVQSRTIVTLSQDGQLQIRDLKRGQILGSSAPLETGFIEASELQLSCNGRAVVLDRTRTQFIVVDTLRNAVEYHHRFDVYQVVFAICWRTLAPNREVLAIAFEHDVQILAEAPYDSTGMGSCWRFVKSISIKGVTEYSISSLSWIGGDDLVIAAGNQLYVSETDLAARARFGTDLFSTDSLKLSSVCDILNADLPIFHPEVLSRLVCDGYFDVAVGVIRSLHRRLKFYSEGDGLHDQIMTDLSLIPGAALTNGHINGTHDEPDLISSFAEDLNITLRATGLPFLHKRDVTRLPRVISAISNAEKMTKSVDSAGLEFLYRLFSSELEADMSQANSQALPSEFVALGFQSSSQDILVTQISTKCSEKIFWKHASRTGMFLWLKDIEALRQQFETMARNEFNCDEERNPTRVSLYYVALRKKAVLLGLWRLAIGNAERAATQKFLSNDFDEPRWKTAALKNAYALLGRRRYEYAASFFLLADRLEDAVNVCVNEIHDLQLAIAVIRVYAGDDAPVLKRVLKDQVLPHAAKTDDRFLASWVASMLQQYGSAMLATSGPVHLYISLRESLSLEEQSYQGNKPDLLRLYQHLRQAQLDNLLVSQNHRDLLSPQQEAEFLKRTLNMYGRMRMPLLALLLTTRWNFVHQTNYVAVAVTSQSQPGDGDNQARQEPEDGKESKVVDHWHQQERTKRGEVDRLPPPREAFQDASSSIFDAFNF